MLSSTELLKPNLIFTTLDNTPSPVTIWFGTTNIMKDGSESLGPTPLIDISKTYNMSDDGNISSLTTSINLTGKIVTKETGIRFDDVMNKKKKFEDNLKKCSMGILYIKCGDTTEASPLYEIPNTYLKQLIFDTTDNNWTKFINYTASLESKETIVSGSADKIENRVDNWTIEPLEQIYTFHKEASLALLDKESGTTSLGKNTLVKPGETPAIGGGNIGGIKLDNFNVPQFKITRKLSAKGLPVPTGVTNEVCLDYTKKDKIDHTRLINAMAWVNKESEKVFNTAGVQSGQIRLHDYKLPTPFNASGTWCYNHSRIVNTDVYNGTYEVTDTWLAMPSGTLCTETFTLDCSNDTNGNKTIRVAGNIQGLVIKANNQTDETHKAIDSGNMKVNVSGSFNNTIKMNAPIKLAGDSATNSSVTALSDNKYMNALSGWTANIKPYLYRRASLGNQYSYHGQDRAKPLSVIPVSTSESHDTNKGIITYNYEYNNRYRAISGVLSENISITDNAPVNVITETPILGRELGPILNSLGYTNPSKTITIDIVVQPPNTTNGMLRNHVDCPLYISGAIYGAIKNLINGNKPFDNRVGTIWANSLRNPTPGHIYTSNDSETWEPTDGKYNRTVTWTYQHCDINTLYLDH
jgi:hypothetical protein